MYVMVKRYCLKTMEDSEISTQGQSTSYSSKFSAVDSLI